ncbi:Abi family protein [Lactococcus lactis]|uniref:Abi family protein n=1 Tax=Lactococcus lactis TaxID=1358 RepID=UPI002891D1E9|nr:Abi family protein [Lactococcus lactis]MDT2874370.1 Abi family protein [Lactococcus lactis]MDT2936286.1 Abi family protein [Lactococcus lactis]MDT2971536.1 Abi family protein [Lactococcus lactis]
MGKNKSRKKNGSGEIIDIFRNYGFIRTDSFGQDMEEIPFEITKDMIQYKDGKEFIEYSVNVNFELKKGVFLRDRNIREAINLKFDKNNLITRERKQSIPYLEQVKEKFNYFNVEIPDLQKLKKDFLSTKDFRDLLLNDNVSPSKIDEILSNFSKSNELIFKTDDDVLYEYLKQEGFHPYMLEYFVNGLFLNKGELSLLVPTEKQQKLTVSDIVLIDKIDKIFREKILKWILEIENAYKSLLSRISTNETGGDIIAGNVVKYWANSTDKEKSSQYKRAKNRYKYLRHSDQFDYIGNEFIPIDDLMDQMDLSNLENLLTAFDNFSKAGIEKDGQKIKAIFPWVRDIVLHKEVLRDLRVIRNAAAHGRSIIPRMVDPDFNPNWDMEIDNPTGRTKIAKWDLFQAFQEYNLRKGATEETSLRLMQTIYGNPYRKAWFELNFIYHRFISLFDSKRYQDFCVESAHFLNYMDLKNRNDEEIFFNPILADMGDLTAFEAGGIPPAYRVIANEAINSRDVAENHRKTTMQNQLGDYF